MINLHQRSYQAELMDAEDISFTDMSRTLQELNIINTRLGGHAITIQGLKKLMTGKKLTVCEIGCGGGDNLFAVYQYCQKRKLDVSFIGVDLNATCIEFAKQRYPQLPCTWMASDYALVQWPGSPPDIIFSSLFCHHFRDEELADMLVWLRHNSGIGFFINDLQRHWLAYYLIKYITRFFSKSYLVKNDAPLSVARSFRKADWEMLFKKAGIDGPQIWWKWAFRWLVVSNNKRS